MALSEQDIEFLNKAPFGTAYRWTNQQGPKPLARVPAILSAPVGDYACYDRALDAWRCSLAGCATRGPDDQPRSEQEQRQDESDPLGLN